MTLNTCHRCMRLAVCLPDHAQRPVCSTCATGEGTWWDVRDDDPSDYCQEFEG
jgi:hypothetical protein